MESTRNECQGPQFVTKFSGSKGRLLYKTACKHRQTSTVDEHGQTGNRRANMDINGLNHFRTFFPPIPAEMESCGLDDTAAESTDSAASSRQSFDTGRT